MQSKKTLRSHVAIAIADQHVLTADSLFSVIQHHRPQAEFSGHAATAAEAIRLCRQTKPTLLLLDAGMAGRTHLIPEVRRVSATTRILLYCTSANAQDVYGAIRAGADGFVEKSCSRAEFLKAVDVVTQGENFLCARSVNMLTLAVRTLTVNGSHGRDELTPREREVLVLIATGDTSKEIARRLSIGVSTVESHRANLMAKVRARNVAQLIQYASKNGLLDT